MPNQRDQKKKLIGFYATPDEVEALKGLADDFELTFAGFLREIAHGNLVVRWAADDLKAER